MLPSSPSPKIIHSSGVPKVSSQLPCLTVYTNVLLKTMDPIGDFDAFLNEKPTLTELLKHVSISTKWYQIGVLLEINSAKLDDIEKDCQGSDMKALKMFEFWLSSNPSASRKQIIDTLKTETIGENTVAEE